MKTRKIQGFFFPLEAASLCCEIGRLLKRPSQLFKNISNSTKKQKPDWFCFAGLRRKAALILRFHEILIYFFSLRLLKKGLLFSRGWKNSRMRKQALLYGKNVTGHYLFIYFLSRSLSNGVPFFWSRAETGRREINMTVKLESRRWWCCAGWGGGGHSGFSGSLFLFYGGIKSVYNLSLSLPPSPSLSPPRAISCSNNLL